MTLIPLNYQPTVVLLILLLLIVLLYKEWFKPVISFTIVVILFLFLGIITPMDALSGFSNEQVAVLFLLLILSEIIRRLSVLDLILKKLFSTRMTYKGFLWRLTASVAGLSAFVNNTPLVAILIPYVYDWAKKKRIAPSRLMIPLSYAALMGGTITLIGTSTNLVLSGLMVQSGFPPLGFFDFTAVGLPVTILGILYLIIMANKVLPVRRDVLEAFPESSREYLAETFVSKDSVLVGKTVKAAGLRSLKGLFLVEIIRDDEVISPVPPDEVLRKSDTLTFAGDTSTLAEIVTPGNGLNVIGERRLSGDRKEIVEVVVAPNSILIGKTINAMDFRHRFDSAVVGIHRNGEKVSGKVGEVILQPGDMLLVIAGGEFRKRMEETTALFVVSKVKELNEANIKSAVLFGIGAGFAFLLAALNIVPLFLSLLSLLAIVGITNMVKVSDLKRTLDMDVVLIMAFALAIGHAIQVSKTDELLTGFIVNLPDAFQSPVMLLIILYLVTNIITMFVTNAAAVAIVFPVALSLAQTAGINPVPFVLTVGFAASADFITPFGYQTNLMVMGPGGYKFRDYTKAGAGLTLLFMATTIIVLSYIYRLW